MPLQQVLNVNFGKNRSNATGSTGVGYTLIDLSGSVLSSRSTLNVTQLVSGSGLYQAPIEFPDSYRGSVLWDTGAFFSDTCYATEQYNEEANNPLIRDTYLKLSSMSGSIETLKDYSEGRWIIEGNQMKFYKSDNTTLVATFNLFDDSSVPTEDAVFERVRV